MTFTTKGPIVDVVEVRTLSQLDEKALGNESKFATRVGSLFSEEDKKWFYWSGPRSLSAVELSPET